MFVPLFPNDSVLGRTDHQCSSLEIRVINCIDEHGITNCIIMICFVSVTIHCNYCLIDFLQSI